MFDINLTKHLAELSKLKFSDAEFKKITGEMSDIIELMDRVKEVDFLVPTHTISAVNYDNLRTDEAYKSYDTSEIIKNAKAVKNSAFTVPKVV